MQVVSLVVADTDKAGRPPVCPMWMGLGSKADEVLGTAGAACPGTGQGQYGSRMTVGSLPGTVSV